MALTIKEKRRAYGYFQELLQTIGQYDPDDLTICRDLIDTIIFYLKD